VLIYLLVEDKKGEIMNYDKLTEEYMDSTFLKKPIFHRIGELSRGEIGTLLYLDFEKNNALAGEISARLDLTSGRLASVLKSLVKKGYIMRRKSENDGRQTIVSITDKGHEYVLKDKEIVFGSMKRMFMFLGEHDANEFVRINKRLIFDFKKDDIYGADEKQKEKK
jgi:DNA-binding MarR family transcriptional regulator